MLKYLLGTDSGIQGDELGASDEVKPEEVEWQTAAIEGKLDLLVTLDFRMSSTCLFSDIVLPTATWYEKDDMNTSDMHPFIHPLSAAVDPAWEAKSDWEIYKDIAKSFSQVCVGHLGKETDVVLVPLQHDSPGELSQPFEVLDWRKGECDLIPGKTAPSIAWWNATILPHGNASPLSARCSISLATAEKAFRGIRKAKSISSASLTTSSPMVRPKAGRGSTAPLTPLKLFLASPRKPTARWR